MKRFNSTHAASGVLAALAAGVLLAVGVGVTSRASAQAQELSGTQARPIGSALSDEMTREQLAALYLKLNPTQFQPPSCFPGEEMFDDVPWSNPFCSWIEELARRGVTGGCTATSYCPGSPVTRAQMAAFVVKATEACARGIKAYVTIALANVSDTEYSTAGLGNSYMCREGSVYAKRKAVGLVDVVFHPAGQTGQFGTIIGKFPIANTASTGPDYFANVGNAGNPGDPPFGYSSITAYRVRVADDAGNPVDQSAKIAIF